MKITLVRPHLGMQGRKRYDSAARMEPLALAVLAGVTPPDVELAFWDDRFEEIPFDAPTDLVAISLCTFSARRGYEIARRYRERGVPVVIGGFHPTLVPDEGLAHADAVALGEVEAVWPQVVEDARAGRLARTYRAACPPSLDGLLPDRRIFAGKRYAPIACIQFGRGCRHACDFCSVRAFYRGRLNHRPVADVLREIEEAGKRWVFFVDDNIAADRERCKELLRAIAPLGLSWTSQVDIGITEDAELMALFRRSGCQSLIVGLESLNDANLRQMRKGWARSSRYAAQLAVLRDAGIMVYGTFVIGYDGDRVDVFRRTLDFAMEQKLFLANFNPLQPFPGTPLYERFLAEGRLIQPRWWLDGRFRWGDAVYHPRGMSARDLSRGCMWARLSFNKVDSILSRFWEFSANAGSFWNALTFLGSNFVSRNDIMNKVGLRLGGEP